MSSYSSTAEPIGDTSWTWTSSSRLGENLIAAEEIFGKRDMSYTILGVEYTNYGPNIWYPFDKHIAIQLHSSALVSEALCLFQLSHEVVHLITPCFGSEVTVLEEGAAVWFQLQRTEAYGYDDITISNEIYEKAVEIYKKLISFDSNAILKLREVQPHISSITYDDIMKVFPKFSKKVAKDLTKRMFNNE